MTKRLLVVLCLILSILLTACTAGNDSVFMNQSENSYQRITAEKAKEMMDAGNVVVVDVRTAEEYQEAHISGAVLVPYESMGDTLLDALPDEDAILLVYCRSGSRSKQASEKLIELGYTQVYDFGGIVDWPYERESGDME